MHKRAPYRGYPIYSVTQVSCGVWIIEKYAQLTPEISGRESGLCPRCEIDTQRLPANNSRTLSCGGGGMTRVVETER